MPDQTHSLDSLIGTKLSHYLIIEEIGSGGRGHFPFRLSRGDTIRPPLLGRQQWQL
jgi:hypothetical protein